jgi:hypothetical protein
VIQKPGGAGHLEQSPVELPHAAVVLDDHVGFARYEVRGGFDRRPLTPETDAMAVLAWAGE